MELHESGSPARRRIEFGPCFPKTHLQMLKLFFVTLSTSSWLIPVIDTW